MERRFGIMKRIGRTATLAYLRILTKVLKILHTVAHNEDGLAPGKSTYSDRFSRKLNHSKTPDSKGQGEAYIFFFTLGSAKIKIILKSTRCLRYTEIT